MFSADMMSTKQLQMKTALRAITLEPIMLIDGACSNAMIILMENIQMIKICRYTFQFSEEVRYRFWNNIFSNALSLIYNYLSFVCNWLSTFPQVCANLPDYEEENMLVQRELSMFTFYNSIVLSVVSLIFILFMGAWSDMYGRKVIYPLSLYSNNGI